MPAEVTIKTRLPKYEVKKVLHDLPGILSGKKHDRFGLRDVFYGVLARELYAKITQEFLKKSGGGADDLGNGWLPLAPSTLARRKSPKLHRYPLAIQNLILRVSDKLFHTLQPGSFDGLRYHPQRNQIFHHARGKLTIGSKLDYASHVHSKRPLWPEDLSPWIESAISTAMTEVIRRLKESLT